jgi:hypothetical protein
MKTLKILCTSILLIAGCNDEKNPVTNDYSIDADFKLMDTNNVEKVIFKSNENVQFYLRIRNTGKDFTMGKGTCEYGLFHIYKGDSLLGTHLDGVTCINFFSATMKALNTRHSG